MTMSRADLARLDADDPLAARRADFALPDGVIYLDGNSLGALPRATGRRLAEVVGHEWGEGLIRSWNQAGWIDLGVRVATKIGHLIGAAAGEVAVADSTSINLYKLLAAAIGLRPGRRTVLTEEGNFPTDIYIAEGLLGQLGPDYRLRRVPAARIGAAVDDDTAVVMLTHVNYLTGAMHDATALTRAAQARGALMLWDLSHSAGALPVDLGAAGADLAVGCGYKYLNGGPGAPAWLYVAARHHAGFRQPLSGWLGHAEPFAFEDGYRPAPGIARAICGTPPILSLAALECGVDTFAGMDMGALRAKSMRMGDLFIALVEDACAGQGLTLASPREATRRGSQVSFRHGQGYAAMQALIARGVIGDFREPDVMRFGFAPLYLRYVDLWDAAEALREVLVSRAYDRLEHRQRAAVT
ncbi:kynureninase [Desertibaculum subflavum]|uniref:kynureninase n=1 Tax=Desertibaculum subflavum TaxID=2268458 RepID=UPI000E66569E